MKPKVMLIAVLLLCVAFAGACGAGASKLDIKVGGKALTLNIKSTGVGYGNIINTSPGKPSIQTSDHYIYIANYEMDTTNVGTMRKPLTAPEQIRVGLALLGEAGTKDDTPFKVGTYSAKAEKINAIWSISVATFADGKQTETDFDSHSFDKKVDGEVKITAVTADTVSGDVNLTEGDKSIKGTFTAKLPKAK